MVEFQVLSSGFGRSRSSATSIVSTLLEWEHADRAAEEGCARCSRRVIAEELRRGT